MSLPRYIVPGSFYMITRRCTQRMFLMRPDEETNNAFLYCLIEAAQRYGIELLLPSALSNHHHTGLYDRPGRVIEFMEHFHKMFAKSQNALRGRWENFWSSEQVCLVRLEGPEDVLDKLAYAAANPVKDGLVERVAEWPGVNGLSALLTGRPLVAHRPRHFFRENGPMPASVSLELTIPPELGDANEFRRKLKERVEAIEANAAETRRATGARVLGRRAILRQAWWAAPTSSEPRRNLRPRIAARSLWSRLAALGRNHAFLVAYQEARAAWLAGIQTVFPVGTYWLKRFANVPIATPATV